MDYTLLAKQMKAIAEPNRMKIIDLLSCGTMCACELLNFFAFSQPTLSHHMKVLEEAGIVCVTKDSKWHYYALESTFSAQFQMAVKNLFADDETCSCQEQPKCVHSSLEKIKEGKRA